ncbi:MAG: hypothetical protein ACYDD0_08880 [Candidatus Dormibacteria bacterium]
MKDRHLAADGVDMVPVSSATRSLAANGPAMPTLPPQPPPRRPANLPRPGVVPSAGGAPSAALPRAALAQGTRAGQAQGWPDPEDLQTQAKSILAAAANVARQLPPQLRVHLNPERLLEVALGSVITTDLTTEVCLAAAGAVLSWAHDLPVPLDPLLNTYGQAAAEALLQVRSALELLGALDPSQARLGSLP